MKKLALLLTMALTISSITPAFADEIPAEEITTLDETEDTTEDVLAMREEANREALGTESANVVADVPDSVTAMSNDTADAEDNTGLSYGLPDEFVNTWAISGDYGYTLLSDGTAALQRYIGGDTEHLVLPTTIDGYTVSRIDRYFFLAKDTVNIKTVQVPKTMRFIDRGLDDLATLEAIYVDDDNIGNYYSIDGVLCKTYGKGTTNPRDWLISYPPAKPGDTYIIPTTIETLEYAFSKGAYYKYLENLIIPDTVSSFLQMYCVKPINIYICSHTRTSFNGDFFYHLVPGTKIYVKNSTVEAGVKDAMFMLPGSADEFDQKHYGCAGTDVIVDDGTSANTVWNHATDMYFNVIDSNGAEYYLSDNNHRLDYIYNGSAPKYNVMTTTANGKPCTDVILGTNNLDTGASLTIADYYGTGMSQFSMDDITIKTNGSYPFSETVKVTTGSTADAFSNVTCTIADPSIAEVTSVGTTNPEATISAKKAGTTTITISATYIDGKTYTATGTLSVTDEMSDAERIDIEQESCFVVCGVSYTGKVVVPLIEYDEEALTENVDYTINLNQTPIDVGDYPISVTGIGKFKGTITDTLSILPIELKDNRWAQVLDIDPISAQTYTGNAITPAIVASFNGMTLQENKDYTLTYKNNVNPGTATITINGIGNFTGTMTRTFKIEKKAEEIKTYPIDSVSSIKTQYYTGKAIKPVLTVKAKGKILKNGTDYTVSYKNNKYPGRATATIKGKGNYTGTKTVRFNITVKTSKTKISSLKSSTKKTVKVTYKKISGATGYQIQYSKNKNFKSSVKTIKTKVTTKTLKSLKSGKKYYVRVRMYRTINKKNYYGGWSSVKSMKVK